MKLLTNLNLSTQITQIKTYIAQQLTNFLPKIGGTLTGNITFQSDEGYIKGIDDSETLYRMQIGNTNGSNIELYKYIENNSNNQGHFKINVVDGNSITSLIGTPNGALTWNGNNILLQQDVVAVTGITLGSSVTAGYYSSIYRCGPIVCVHINIKPPASLAAETVLMSGLPAPIKAVIGAVTGSNKQAYSIKIQTDGNMAFQDASPTESIYLDGTICYLTMN